ncbi:MAG: PilZ domain-containing protein [Chitinispirillaceae bacterium]|nr:PilZ domain-containing protein [Chitinispirillaceae bacterium]
MAPFQKNRRTVKRVPLRKALETSFYNGGHFHYATMVDISANGARFSICMGLQEKLPSVAEGRMMEYYVTTSQGRSKCRGLVQWVHRDGRYMNWGITFRELSPYAEDALRKEIALTCLLQDIEQRMQDEANRVRSAD